MTSNLFGGINLEPMNELQTQVLEKGLCFHCHARTLKNMPDTTIYNCMRCRRVYIAEEGREPDPQSLTGGNHGR